MEAEMAAEGDRGPLIEENLHATRRLRAAWSRTASACSWVTPGNQSRKSSSLAPDSRFSKSALTGTRVPRKTQAPLTRSGERSTARHCDQSSIKAILAIPAPRRQRAAGLPMGSAAEAAYEHQNPVEYGL